MEGVGQEVGRLGGREVGEDGLCMGRQGEGRIGNLPIRMIALGDQAHQQIIFDWMYFLLDFIALKYSLS